MGNEVVMNAKCNVTGTREKETCGCMDVGTIVDNTDCSAVYSQQFSQRQEAEAKQQQLIAKARSIESEPCQITSQLSDTPSGVTLDMSFTFSCQAETLIFQLGLR
jgi:uncharacterized protein (TIGR00743 family)